jgi:hypothetical protein
VNIETTRRHRSQMRGWLPATNPLLPRFSGCEHRQQVISKMAPDPLPVSLTGDRATVVNVFRQSGRLDVRVT